MEPPLTGMEPHRDRHLPYAQRIVLRWRARVLLVVGFVLLVLLMVLGLPWLADRRTCADDPVLPSGPPAARDAALAVYEDRCGSAP